MSFRYSIHKENISTIWQLELLTMWIHVTIFDGNAISNQKQSEIMCHFLLFDQLIFLGLLWKSFWSAINHLIRIYQYSRNNFFYFSINNYWRYDFYKNECFNSLLINNYSLKNFWGFWIFIFRRNLYHFEIWEKNLQLNHFLQISLQ